MSTEENTFEPGPEDGYAAEGGDTYPAEPESPQKDNRTPLIAGGVVIAALVAVTCCLAIVAAVLISRGGGGDTVPTLPPINLPTNTPAAPAPDVPTPTPGDEPQPTPTSAVGPNAIVSAPAQAMTGEQVSFDGSQSQPGTSPIARYDWDFGDGNKGSGAVVRYVYRNPGDYMVTLTITDQDGLTDTAPAQIEIISSATAEPTATPEPTLPPVLKPEIDSFEVDPEEISLSQCVELSWSTSGGTTEVDVFRGEYEVWDNAPLQGSVQDCPDEAGAVDYRLVAYNAEGKHVHEDVTVTVSE